MEGTGKPTALERFDYWFIGALRLVLVLLMAGLFIWAALLMLVQCVAWLKTGAWQPVPLATVFLSSESPAHGSLMQLGRRSALVAPSWASFVYPEEVAATVAGTAMGVFRIVLWLLEVALSVWLCVLACLAGGISAALEPVSKTH